MSLPLVLVPVKELDRAKQRLAEALAPDERAALAEATLRTVLQACGEAELSARVLTDDARAAEVAESFGVPVLAEDPAARGLNGQLEAALEKLEAPEAGVLILHADLPLATGEALRAFVEAAPPVPSVTMLRSSDGGTNAMLLRPPGRFRLAYGDDSFARHRAAAEAAGVPVTQVEDERLKLDLDTPDDLEAFLANPAHAGTPAAEVLRPLAPEGRFAV